jgi:TPP-dependent indolepyruvate ferredoxin oxidoreductase alpha subunit
LKSRYFPIKQKAAEAITEIKDENFIPDLIKSLDGNQGIVAGGTETEVMQNDLNKAIISALECLTKLKFNVTYPLSDENIKEVLDKSQKWCSSHKEVCDKQNVTK